MSWSSIDPKEILTAARTNISDEKMNNILRDTWGSIYPIFVQFFPDYTPVCNRLNNDNGLFTSYCVMIADSVRVVLQDPVLDSEAALQLISEFAAAIEPFSTMADSQDTTMMIMTMTMTFQTWFAEHKEEVTKTYASIQPATAESVNACLQKLSDLLQIQ